MSETTDEDLRKLAKKFNIPINDICYKDLLNDNLPKKGGYIINLADSADFGTHWTALWIDKPGHCAYFDSFGIVCPFAVEEFAKKYGCYKIIMSNVQIQSLNSGWCGEYCIDLRYKLFLNQFHKD